MTEDEPATRTASPPFLPDYLLFLLATASAAGSAEFHAMARARGLRVPEWRVLACLHDADGQMVTHLAQLALMEQSRLTRVLDGMVGRGLVTRTDDPRDRRRVRVWLTDQGRVLAADLVGQALAHEAHLLAQIGAEEGRALKAALKHLNAAIAPRIAPDAGPDIGAEEPEEEARPDPAPTPPRRPAR